MTYNTKALITDVNGKPVPQVYNPATDAFEPLQGSTAGGPRTILYDASGNPLLTAANPGIIKLSTITRVEQFVNSTNLAASATYTSPSIDGLNYRRIVGFVNPSHAGSLGIYHSDDGVTWYGSTINITAGEKFGYDEPFYGRYAQVKFINGGTALTSFKIAGYTSPV